MKIDYNSREVKAHFKKIEERRKERRSRKNKVIVSRHDSAEFFVFDTKGKEFTQDLDDARRFGYIEALKLWKQLNNQNNHSQQGAYEIISVCI